MTPKTILIVEDSLPVRDFIETSVLRPAGFATLVAGDGEEGLKVARAARPDLIVTDFHLPEMDGLAMVRQLRAERRCPPVILVTVEPSSALAGEARQAGVVEYLVKPFVADDLLAAVNRALGMEKMKAPG